MECYCGLLVLQYRAYGACVVLPTPSVSQPCLPCPTASPAGEALLRAGLLYLPDLDIYLAKASWGEEGTAGEASSPCLYWVLPGTAAGKHCDAMCGPLRSL